MAASTAHADYFSGKPAARSRPAANTLREATHSPRSPRTPQLGRSISSQFGSPGSFRVEQEDIIIYELGARHLSAGFAGESRPRCILPFNPDNSRRVADYRHHDPMYLKDARKSQLAREWGAGYELYTTDVRTLDLGLVEDKLLRALRTAMIDYLQLDSKPRKAILVVPSRLPIPLLDIACRVLFTHFTQPPSIALLSHSIMSCVGSGLRNALVVDIGWEETVVTAVGEHKEVAQKRSTRAGKTLTREVGNVVEEALRAQGGSSSTDYRVAFSEAEDITQRMAWCRSRLSDGVASEQEIRDVELPVPGSNTAGSLSLSFAKLADPVDKALFGSETDLHQHDDEEFPVHLLAYKVLLALPVDLRALCVSRVVVSGGVSKLPGLKRRLLQELAHLVERNGWDPVWSYGSVNSHITPALKERSTNITGRVKVSSDISPTLQLSPLKMPIQDSVPHADRVHDDIKDPVTTKAERAASKGKIDPIKGVFRGVSTLGPWAGASLVASLRVKGVHEVDRDDFLKHGLRHTTAAI